MLIFISGSYVSKWGDSTGEESLKAKNTWEERFKTQKWERRKRGGEKISTDSFSLVHRFLLLFWLVKNSILFFFFDIWTKNAFPHFSANDCDLILYIMLALEYYHSMMLRCDQFLYEFIAIAQRLLLADTYVRYSTQQCYSTDVYKEIKRLSKQNVPVSRRRVPTPTNLVCRKVC